MGALLRLLLLCGAVYLLFAVVRSLFLPSKAPKRTNLNRQKGGKTTSGTAMVQDPECGRFIAENESLSVPFGQKRLHFCSPECRDIYRRSEAIDH